MKSALLKLGAAKVWPLAFPVGVIVLGTIWIRQARVRLPPSVPRQRGSAALREEAEAIRPAVGDGADYAKNHQRSVHVANTDKPISSTPYGTDREALLSRIIDDNVRLREALK
jgi:hypothetical protein